MTAPAANREAQGYADTLALAAFMLRDLSMPVWLKANLQQLIAAYLHFEVAGQEVQSLREQAKEAV